MTTSYFSWISLFFLLTFPWQARKEEEEEWKADGGGRTLTLPSLPLSVFPCMVGVWLMAVVMVAVVVVVVMVVVVMVVVVVVVVVKGFVGIVYTVEGLR